MGNIINIFNMVKGIDFSQIVSAILMILGGFSIIAKLTPTKADDKIIASILKVIHGLGLTK